MINICNSEVISLIDAAPHVITYNKDATGETINLQTTIDALFAVTPTNTVNPMCMGIEWTGYTDQALTTQWAGSAIITGSQASEFELDSDAAVVTAWL